MILNKIFKTKIICTAAASRMTSDFARNFLILKLFNYLFNLFDLIRFAKKKRYS
jgi:hypothetical protein